MVHDALHSLGSTDVVAPLFDAAYDQEDAHPQNVVQSQSMVMYLLFFLFMCSFECFEVFSQENLPGSGLKRYCRLPMVLLFLWPLSSCWPLQSMLLAGNIDTKLTHQV